MSRTFPRFHRSNPSLPAAVANLFEISVIGTLENQLIINTFYVADGGAALLQTTETTLANAWLTANKTLYLACLSSDYNLTAVKAQCLTTPSRQAQTVTVTGAPGAVAGGHEPTSVCGTVIRYSTVKGQAGRGRVAVPAVPLTFTTNSALNATATGPYTGFLAICDGAFVSGAITYTPQIVSRKNKNGPPLGASPCVSAAFKTTLGSCRRRKLGRGK